MRKGSSGLREVVGDKRAVQRSWQCAPCQRHCTAKLYDIRGEDFVNRSAVARCRLVSGPRTRRATGRSSRLVEMIDKVLNPLAVPQNAWPLLQVVASTSGLSHVRSHGGVLLVGARACVPPGMTAVAHLSVLGNEFGKHSGPPYLGARDGRLHGTR